MARTVEDPDGFRWRVGRQWVTREPRRNPDTWRSYDDTGNPLPSRAEVALSSAYGEAGPWALVPIAPIIALVVGFPFLLVWFVAGPVALGAVVAVLVALVVLWLRRRTWTVRAVALTRARQHVWRVRGWEASGAVVEIAAEALRTGGPLPPHARTTGDDVASVPRPGA